MLISCTSLSCSSSQCLYNKWSLDLLSAPFLWLFCFLVFLQCTSLCTLHMIAYVTLCARAFSSWTACLTFFITALLIGFDLCSIDFNDLLIVFSISIFKPLFSNSIYIFLLQVWHWCSITSSSQSYHLFCTSVFFFCFSSSLSVHWLYSVYAILIFTPNVVISFKCGICHLIPKLLILISILHSFHDIYTWPTVSSHGSKVLLFNNTQSTSCVKFCFLFLIGRDWKTHALEERLSVLARSLFRARIYQSL